MTPQQLHIRFTQLVKTERKITHEILLCIQRLDSTKAYAELGYSSLFDYLVAGQKYSEGSAQRRISAARLLREVPEIQEKIQEGALNLTQLAKLSIAVKQEQKKTGQIVSTTEKKEILMQLENKNSLETEHLLDRELQYSPQPQEKLVAKNEDYYLTIKLSQIQLEKLKKAQAILSHSYPNGNYSDIIEAMCEKVIEKKEAAPKGPRKDSKIPATAITTKVTAVTAATSPTKTKTSFRAFIPTATQKYVSHKAQHCCEYVSTETKRRCGTRYQLQIDHRIPLAKGGGNNPENLRLLCRTHNLAEARRWGL
jgi:5-methylcytosine-specific restriction endonuclease McrA